MPTVSFSEVQLFRRCQKAHEYKYKQRLKRIRRNMRMLRGSILHDMLNALIKHKMIKGYKGPDPWDVLAEYEEKYQDQFEEEREKEGDIPGDCGLIFEGYMRKWRKDPLTYEASEEPVFLDLPGVKLRFIGYIDKIATDQKGLRFIVDHKFVQTIPNADARFSEIQLLLYVWAYNLLHPDTPIDGVIWDYGRSKAPTVPEVLKSGKGLTVRKNLDCDPYTYMRTIAENNFDPDDYVEMLEHLQGKEDTFFERVPLPKPSKTMIDNVVGDFMITAGQIAKFKGSAPRSMSPFNCNTCEFRPLCEAEVRGHDADFILDSEYTQREEHGDED